MDIDRAGTFTGLPAGLVLTLTAASGRAASDPRAPSPPPEAPAPTVWGYASPSRIVAGTGYTTLHWGGGGAEYCSYGGDRFTNIAHRIALGKELLNNIERNPAQASCKQ